MKFSLLYRGPLKSCNYACAYCPFAKTPASRPELAADRQALAQFTNWLRSRTADRIAVLFTPWGEALIHPFYQRTLAELSHLPQIEKVVIQTNLSGRLNWLARGHVSRLALWCSFHPGQVKLSAFLAQCLELDRRGVRFSVGAVALKESKPDIQALREQLPGHVYVWLNAYKHRPDYYTAADLAFFESIDPLFCLNTTAYPSQGRPCRSGETVAAVSGNGDLRRCHFIPDIIGNLYTSGIEAALQPRRCTNVTCHCHIGYVHLPELKLDAVFQDGILERIPWVNPKKTLTESC